MRKNILLIFVLFFTLCCSCFKDDTNIDYKELKKPVLLINDEDEHAFKENQPYEVVQGQTLRIVPYVEYDNPEDLSYEWFVDGKSVSQKKVLEWECNISKSTANGTLMIRRNSADNADVYSFFIMLLEPFERAWTVLDREVGKVRLHVVNEKPASPSYIYTPYMNVMDEIEAVSPLGVLEYWSTEKTNIVGEVMYLDADPSKCFSMDGKSLAKTVSLNQEWIGDEIPSGIRFKNALYCGFVDYLLADDGRLYMRKNGKGYYTGRFSDLPVKFEGEELIVSSMTLCQHKSKMAMLFDKKNGRFLVVNTDYDWNTQYFGDRAGDILSFPAKDGVNDWKGYEIVTSKFIKPFYSWDTDYTYFCIMKNPSGGLEALEFVVEFNGRTSPSATITYENIICPANMGVDSKFCILNDPYMGMIKSYVLYSAQDEPNSLYYVERKSKGFGEPKLYKAFDYKIMSLDHGKLGRTNSTVGIGLENGSLMLYDLSKSWSVANEKSFVTEISGFGEILEVNFKYGSVANF